jgi:threonine/homoserine/homoserine lactone efflux protein
VPPTSHLLAFSLTAFVIIAIPGPSVTFIVGRAFAEGPRAALLTVVGNTLGEYVQVVAVAFGIGALIEQSVALFTIVKLIGAAYLVFLGVRTFLDRRSGTAGTSSPGEPSSVPQLLLQGFLVGVSNPKTVVFLAAILPEFVARSSGQASAQILLLGLIFSAIALVSDSVWGLAAGSARAWFARSPRRLAHIWGAGGLAIIAVGVGLALTGRKD